MAGFALISFLTDYGLDDGFVAACHGVLAVVCPWARIVDVTHLVPPQDVRRGAAVLAQTVVDLPPAVHLAVVDPGVGTARRAVAVTAGPSVLVGPDNGLLLWAADALGGPTAAYALTDPRWHRVPVSATFHGRDVFAPVAAHVAAGVSPGALGPAVDVGTLVRLPLAAAEVAVGSVEAEVLTADRFGNLQLAASAAALHTAGISPGDALTVSAGSRSAEAVAGRTFADADAGRLLVYGDSAGLLAVALPGGSAADRLEAAAGMRVRLCSTAG